MKVLLTGNRGYFGSVLEAALRSAGHEVAGLDAGYFTDEGAQPRRDLRDVAATELSGVEAVVNLAAVCNDACGELSASATDQVNHQAAARLATLARRAGTRRFVQASSCGVYGASDGTMLHESSVLSPVTAYATSKAAAEEHILGLATADFAPCVLRFATLFGPSPAFRSDILLNRVVGTALFSRTIRLSGDGTIRRPLLHLADAADAVTSVLAAARAEVGGLTYNVGSTRRNYSLNDVADLVRQELPLARIIREQVSDRRSYIVSFARFETAFPHWRAAHEPAAAVRAIADFYETVPVSGRPVTEGSWGTSDRRGHLLWLQEQGMLDRGLRWLSPRQHHSSPSPGATTA